MIVNTYPKGSKQKLSDNFEAREFSCHGDRCCSTVLIDPDLVEILQKIRNHFGKPVYINSGYRCAKHNKAVGGVSGSYHLKGMAADITVKDVAPAEVAKYAESIGVLGIGLYESNKSGHFVHVDTRTKKSFWYGSEQERRTTFGGSRKTIEEVARDVIAGKYGNGMDRRERLAEAGYDPDVIQAKVNELLARTYTVQKGDTLWGIAEKELGMGRRFIEIKDLNGLTDNTIYPGQVLKMPEK